ncbi:thiamine pyrophosphate-binding protein [Ancylobacter sp. Lp-2]|uniref:thiamine pyrophosphate-binding protein n=1 Tax=Ancylobacter sp. Lp-2 TaxID=2881339 RepID=UPI001E355C11|nr:thiamine pyrophosphate-binding protein [Ancylobacter sp. Lp-2]MCB4771585.1 thiamine pyrophosphate-binding protein [Ancylobacter sp. Lp-2]
MSNKAKTGGALLVECLQAQGVDTAFCVPGESYLAVLDALYEARDAIRLVVCRQEGGAANMAEAYGKLTNRPGVCFVTRGPGATNASTGVHTAFQDSTPMVLFIGQVARRMRHREGFQEVDFSTMFAPLVKWSAEISDPRRIPEYVHRAFQVAMAGRPGPVVLALPEDVLSDLIDDPPEPGIAAHPIPAAAREEQIDRLDEMIAAAARPLIMVGGGGWTQSAGEQLMAYAERRGVPVAVSLRCQDYVDNDHPNYVGHFTIGADPGLLQRLEQADLLVALGPRLGEMTTAGYALLKPPRIGRPFAHIHADPEELGKVYQADLAIAASPAVVASQLAARIGKTASAPESWVTEARAAYEHTLLPGPLPGAVNLGEVMVTLRETLPPDTIVCSGAGNYTGWVHRHWRFHGYRTQLAPTSGAMGYAVPAAIAAKVAFPERAVLSVSGDGCFQMHGQEIGTAAQYGLKILFIVANNGIYGTIRMHQEREFPGRVIATEIVNPDFVALAQAYGLFAERVERTADFAACLDRALKAPGSALIELVTDPEAITARTTLSKLRQTALERQLQSA